MQRATAPAAVRVQAILGDGFEVVEFDASTRTAADAAAAIGCTVAEIAKSLVFRTTGRDRPVLVVTSGTNRVDTAKVAAALGNRSGARMRTSSAPGAGLRSAVWHPSDTSRRRAY